MIFEPITLDAFNDCFSFHPPIFYNAYFNPCETVNGFICPYFDAPESKRVLETLYQLETKETDKKIDYWYNPVLDTFFHIDEPSGVIEKWKGTDINYQGKTIHVYDIGSWSWCWIRPKKNN